MASVLTATTTAIECSSYFESRTTKRLPPINVTRGRLLTPSGGGRLWVCWLSSVTVRAFPCTPASAGTRGVTAHTIGGALPDTSSMVGSMLGSAPEMSTRARSVTDAHSVTVAESVADADSGSSGVASRTESGVASAISWSQDGSLVRELGARLFTRYFSVLYFSVLYFSVLEESLEISSLEGSSSPSCGMDMLSQDSKSCATDPQMACDRTDPRLRCSLSTPCSMA